MLKRYEPKFPYNTVNMMEEIEDGDYVKFTDVKINSIIEQMKKIPQKNFFHADRYDTDDEYVLHLWDEGNSYDIRIPKK